MQIFYIGVGRNLDFTEQSLMPTSDSEERKQASSRALR